MTTLTAEQARALRMVIDGVLDAVAVAGPIGAPGGVLYAALMGAGISLSQFESLMGGLVRLGKLRRSGDLYFLAEPVQS
jgi:hypothetical protein